MSLDGRHALTARDAPLVELRDKGQILQSLGAAENPGHGVVILGADWIEFVIVAAGAAHRQTQKRPTDDIDLLVHHVHHQFGLVLFGQHLGTQHQKSSGHTPFKHLGFRNALSIEKVSRQLIDDELVVGLVGIE